MFDIAYSIFGVPLHKTSRTIVLKQMEQMLKGDTYHYMVTPNPEICLKAFESSEYTKVLQGATLSIPDGFGLLWASTFLERTKNDTSKFIIIMKAGIYYLSQIVYKPALFSVIPETVLGSETFFHIHPFLEKEQIPVFYFGGEDGVDKNVAVEMKRRYPALSVVGHTDGYPYRSEEESERILQTIDHARPKMLFVALSFPWQERWMNEHAVRLEKAGVRLAVGIGGTFDFAVGKMKRAPVFLQRLGFEWLWRVVIQPSRYQRIIRAVFLFPTLVVRKKLLTIS